VDERAVNELRELVRREAELAAHAEELQARDAEIAVVRARAEAIDAFFAAYPDADTKLRAAIAAARDDLARRNDERTEALTLVEQARDDDARQLAGLALARAEDHVATAEARLARASSEHEELEREAAALQDESPREVIEQASREHASVFVELGQVETQRERLIREVNELATMLLGEPTYGATAEQALQLVLRVGAGPGV
jgi:DNA repair exonuclease SbcCD ATPase subunit